MESNICDIQLCEYLFSQFYGIGNDPNGGVTRLGYSKEEDKMHDVLKKIADYLSFNVKTDEVGNTFLYTNNEKDYYLIASHLDSVVNGGRYDGVAGVIAGIMILSWACRDKVQIPIRVGALRCEESSNFGCCTIGSGLINKESFNTKIDNLQSKSGESIRDIFKRNEYTLKPKKINGIKEYIELHIEQGRVLESSNIEVGIVSDIAAPRRYNIYVTGMAEHSGATPMEIRHDAMCAAAEIILEVEKNARLESQYKSVATIGVVNNYPNVLNVIPGKVQLGLDIRGINIPSIDRLEKNIFNDISKICEKRNVRVAKEKISSSDPVSLSTKLQKSLSVSADRLNISNVVMPSGAGHDAMMFSDEYDTGMLFIPCKNGISHNRMEFTELTNIIKGAHVIYDHIRRENYDIN